MKSMSLLFVCCLIVTLANGQSLAQEADRGTVVFNRMDQDKNGWLSREELPENIRGNFSRVDTNQDDRISKEEHLAFVNRNNPNQTKTKTNTKEATMALPANIEAIRDIPYADTENPRQRLDLFLPKNRKSDKPLPVVVFIHGGGWRAGDKNGGSRNVASYVASGEYIGASIGYRLSDEAQWPAQIHDCKAAIRWLKGHAQEYQLDEKKIGVWGSSAGGHLVSMLGTSGDVASLEGTLGKHLDKSSSVACVVNYFGPENFVTMVRQPSTIDRSATKVYPEMQLIGGPVQEKEDVAREASPVTHVTKNDAPFFTAHGTKDPLVPFAQGEELHAALQQAGVPSLFQEMTGGGHGFQSSTLNERVKQFFDRQLRGLATEISTSPIEVTANSK